MPRGIPRNGGKRTPRAAERRANRPNIIDPNQFYSVGETAAAREKCRASVYQEIAAGTLRAVKDGKRTKILGAEIIRANQQQASSAVLFDAPLFAEEAV